MAAIKTNTNIQELLKDTLMYAQKMNESIISLVAAIGEAQRTEAPPAPVVIQQKPLRENMRVLEAADYCGYSKTYMYHLTYRNAIPFHKPMGGRIFFKRTELDEFLARGKKDAPYEVADKAAEILNNRRKGINGRGL